MQIKVICLHWNHTLILELHMNTSKKLQKVSSFKLHYLRLFKITFLFGFIFAMIMSKLHAEMTNLVIRWPPTTTTTSKCPQNVRTSIVVTIFNISMQLFGFLILCSSDHILWVYSVYIYRHVSYKTRWPESRLRFVLENTGVLFECSPI